MGVYIKDMEMPKNEPLLVKINPDGSVSTTAKNGYKKYEAVPVPPHGDLIDRKTSYDSLLDGMVMTGYQSRALDCISDFYVPTIIPAEKCMDTDFWGEEYSEAKGLTKEGK